MKLLVLPRVFRLSWPWMSLPKLLTLCLECTFHTCQSPFFNSNDLPMLLLHILPLRQLRSRWFCKLKMWSQILINVFWKWARWSKSVFPVHLCIWSLLHWVVCILILALFYLCFLFSGLLEQGGIKIKPPPKEVKVYLLTTSRAPYCGEFMALISCLLVSRV